MSLRKSNYHRALRILVSVFFFFLVFESGIVNETTRKLSVETHSYLASVIGMSASVQPTELNQYTAELSAWERELEAREASIAEREIKVDLSKSPGNNDTSTYILASILFILLVLILLNYTLDYLRAKERQLPEVV